VKWLLLLFVSFVRFVKPSFAVCYALWEVDIAVAVGGWKTPADGFTFTPPVGMLDDPE
jgi:hypothetical protein